MFLLTFKIIKSLHIRASWGLQQNKKGCLEMSKYPFIKEEPKLH